MSNAIKYGDCKPIDVELGADDDRAVLVIRDRGVGIAPHDHERIFGRFERAASSRNYGGIGLGLWIVKQIVDALGGTVNVESTQGSGSTFTVELPRARVGAPRTATPANGHGLTHPGRAELVVRSEPLCAAEREPPARRHGGQRGGADQRLQPRRSGRQPRRRCITAQPTPNAAPTTRPDRCAS
jgi:hypothetical protein